MESDQVNNDEFSANEDGSYRLSEYKVELTLQDFFYPNGMESLIIYMP